ncbi:MAG: hypothetical protein AB1631_04210 [Acidobacteriota bacterium]
MATTDGSEYVDFISALMREYYLHHSGRKEDLEVARIYDRYSDLFSPDAIDRIRRELEQTSEHFETERAALRRRLLFAMEHFLENSARHITEEISQYESQANVEWLGRRMTFQESVVAVMRERDRGSRRAIYQKRVAVISSSNDLRAARLSLLHQSARDLGYKSYRALFEELRETSYEKLAREAQTLLDSTESVFVSRLDEALRSNLGISVEEAQRHDAHYFLHLTSYDGCFPADRLLTVYEETMSGLGVGIHQQSNIEIDSEVRPRKSPRAFCAPVSIPDEIKLVIRPAGGQSDYQAFLHESGHAQHYGWTSPHLRPEFKYMGDYALTETFAFLFNHLASESAWLARFLDFSNNREFVLSVLLARLVTIRRYAAKLLYECHLHASETLSDAANLYAQLQSRSTGFKTGRAEFLFDLDDSFYSANYLRAWAFEVRLREHLKEKFGREWWTSRKAGNFLKEMWETGDRYSADEMSSQLGLGPISFDTLIEEFNRALK